MPVLLKADSLKALEGGIEAYILAMCGIALPDLRFRRVSESRYAPTIGLLGTCTELLSKACLIQAKGSECLVRDNGFFKYGSEIIEGLKTGISKEDSDLGFLWEDHEDPDLLRDSLADFLLKFRLLQTLRAVGLHAGEGPSRDVVITAANDVWGFIEILSSCKRLRPYLKGLPAPQKPVLSRGAILEDLARRLATSDDLKEQSSLLRSIYLVLPYVPELMPEWLSAFDRVTATPRDQDVKYLVNSLSEAHQIHLFKQGNDGRAIPVMIDNDNPNAIPISISFLKRSITKVPEQFHSDVALANGRFEEGFLDLPPEDFLLDLYTVELDNSGVIGPRESLTAQQTWPFVASALSSVGTPRPYWFLVRRCDDLPKLATFLQRTSRCGNAYFRKRVDEVLLGVQCILEDVALPRTSSVLLEMGGLYEESRQRRNSLFDKIRDVDHAHLPPLGLAEQLEKVDRGEILPGSVLEGLIGKQLTEEEEYWRKQLARSVFCYQERVALMAVLRNPGFESYRTIARKMMRLNDFIKFGPSLEGIDRTAAD